MTASIRQDIYFDTIILDVKANNVKQVFQQLSQHVSSLIGSCEEFLSDSLLQREQHQNSGIGNGVAIIDAKLPRLTRPMVVYAKIEKDVEFNAADGEPVDIVVLVLSPEFEGTQHLQRLASISRFFRSKENLLNLREAKDYQSVRAVAKAASHNKKSAA